MFHKGLLILSYSPREHCLDNLKKSGCLPIVDYVSSLKYDEDLLEYIVSGNCVGELSTLTGRSYNCTITADTHCQAYFLSRDIIKQAMALSPDPVTGYFLTKKKSFSIK